MDDEVDCGVEGRGLASEVDAEVDCGVEGRGFAKGERKRKLLRLLSGKETHSSCHSVWSLQAPACNGAI